MTPIRIVIAERHSLIRAGFRQVLQQWPEYQVVGEASDGQQALDLVAKINPDVLITASDLPGISGFDLAGQILKSFTETRIIMVSVATNSNLVGKAIKIGVAGFILLETEETEIRCAIDIVFGGKTYLTPRVTTMMTDRYVREMARDPKGKPEDLTQRQREILRLIAHGNSTKKIAHLLEISPKTVQTHRAQIMERLDIHDVPNLVRYAMRSRLIPLET